MRRSLLVAFVLAFSIATVPAEETTYGGDLALTETTAIGDILARPHEFEGDLVRVEGTVAEVCQHLGCWLRVGDEAGARLLARSSGDKVTIPTDAAGRKVVVEGVVVVEHEGAEETPGHGEAEDCPTAVVRLETRAVRLL